MLTVQQLSTQSYENMFYMQLHAYKVSSICKPFYMLTTSMANNFPSFKFLLRKWLMENISHIIRA